MFNFERLTVYQEAIDFSKRIYRLTEKFPRQERFGVVDQLRRAAVSVAANIAEGSSRTKREFKNFLRIARGSLYECICLLNISCETSYIPQETYFTFYQTITMLSKRLSALMRSLEK